MRLLFIVLIILIPLIFSSCFVRTNRLSFQNTVAMASKHADFNKDSIRCMLLIDGKTRNIVVPFFIFVGDKKKSRICYRLYGKGISAREYTCRFIHLEIKNDSEIVGKSKDSALFREKKEIKYTPKAISPFYVTDYLLELNHPAKMNLFMEMEFEIEYKSGIKENFALKTPLKKVYEKNFSLFNPFKK